MRKLVSGNVPWHITDSSMEKKNVRDKLNMKRSSDAPPVEKQA
jgi:hypothetical protein